MARAGAVTLGVHALGGARHLKHRSIEHTVRAIEPVDGPRMAYGYGQVARLSRKTGRQSLQTLCVGLFRQKALRVESFWPYRCFAAS